MFIVERKLTFTPSTSPDAVEHRIVVVPEGNLIDLNTPYVSILMPETEYILPGAFTMSPEGTYKIGLYSVDGIGNKSDIQEVTGFFDFTAPDAPTNLVIV